MKNTAAFEGSVLAKILGTREMGFAVSWRKLLLTTSPAHPTTASKLYLSTLHLQEAGASQSLAST